MADKILQTRIALKSDNAATWNNSSFVPMEGEAVILKGAETGPGWDIKVGDNVNTVPQLTGLAEGIQGWVEDYVANELKVADALIFKGVVFKQEDIPTAGMLTGWTLKIGTSGKYTLTDSKGNTRQIDLNVGDLIIWGEDANSATDTKLWMIVQSNLTSATFTGNQFTITHPAHNAITGVSSTFKGTQVNISHSFTPTGNVTITKNNKNVSHGHTFTGTEGTVTVTGTSAGSVGYKAPTPTGNVTAEFQGTAASHKHTFTGTAANHKHTFTGTQATLNSSYTPAGTVGYTNAAVTGTVNSTFTGEEGDVVVTGTAVGAVGISAINGTINSHKHSFTGTAANITVPYQVIDNITAASHTPTGNVTSTFAGKGATVNVTGTATGNTGSASHTPTGNITISIGGAAATAKPSYTPAGTVANHSHSVSNSKTTIKQFNSFSAGTLPSLTAANNSRGTLINSLVTTQGGTASRPSLKMTSGSTNISYVESFTWNAGTLPSLTTADISVVTGVGATTGNTAPAFTGTATNIAATFKGDAHSHTHGATLDVAASGAYTPEGTVTSTFVGDANSHTHAFTLKDTSSVVAYTPAGTINNVSLKWTYSNATATFAGTPFESTGKFTPIGTVNSTFSGYTNHNHGFTGTAGTATVTYTPAGTISNTSITPAGTISDTSITPAGSIVNVVFTGDPMNHNHGFTGSSHSATGKFTPAGTISSTNVSVLDAISANFTGDAMNVGYSYTPAGTITNTYTWNNKAASTEKITPTGTVTLTTTE